MVLASVCLDDKYDQRSGKIFITGIQALARLPLLQHDRDVRNGLNTGTYISGYRGSPMGGYDTALLRMGERLADRNIVFASGLNEETAVNAVWGSQQGDMFGDATVDGVVGIWYAKGVGVARGMDALKHANFAGTARNGGVLALVGDDHGCQSSAIPHQSDQDLVSAMIPVLAPSDVQEILDYGQIGIAMSRFTGCWVALKLTVETLEIAATVDADFDRPAITTPADFVPPPGGLGIRWPDPAVEAEVRLHGPKMDAVQAFARANPVDRMIYDARSARLGIVTTGKAYQDVRQALDELGIAEAEAAALGLRLYKVGMVWPLERQGALRFVEGLDEILVIEEKRGLIEDQLAVLLLQRGGQVPRLLGKTDTDGAVLIPSVRQLDPEMVGRAIHAMLVRNGVADRARLRPPGGSNIVTGTQTMVENDALPVRAPFFCSGCPHNRSTKLPDGSKGTGGTGCHAIAIWLPYRNTDTLPQMGGEGLAWLGRSRFSRTKHLFQNLGDGTYSHSGVLAVRAAAASGVNITYKILYNDAVAMTGGQALDNQLTVPQITRQVAAEGAKRIAVVTDEPHKYSSDAEFAPGVTIHDRSEMDAVQRELRDIEGLTILVYDQTCAAEKRRRRKRGAFPDPPKRVFINDRVCEGCGDCSAKSHCISVQPLETDLGRKRVIDQSNCNKDYSCLDGFCPSFVTVHGGKVRAANPVEAATFAAPPEPRLPPLDRPWNGLVTGIGGTGVVTVGQIIGMAAHLEGKGCSVLDFTGLAQKNGAVTSHVRIAMRQEDLHAVRIPAGGADLVLGCDAVVAASPVALRTMAHGITRAVVNHDVAPVAAFVSNPDMDQHNDIVRTTIAEAVGRDRIDFVDATRLASRLIGDAVATNLFMLGYAYQRGLVPLTAAAIEEAIRINGAAVDKNLEAFNWGRRAAVDIAAVDAVAAVEGQSAPSDDFDDVLARRLTFLAAYQHEAYAAKFGTFVAAVRAAERAAVPGNETFARTVMEGLFKLMAYKDEYEVARLYSDGAFRRKLEAQFDGDYSLSFHLAPPLFAGRDRKTGELRKRPYGRWMMKAFGVLARFKGLRGTMFDPFGYTAERREERRLPEEYRALVDSLLLHLTPANHSKAVEIAALAKEVRGYGHIKVRNLAKARARQAELMARFIPSGQSSRAPSRTAVLVEAG